MPALFHRGSVHRLAAVLALGAAVVLSACATSQGVHEDYEATKQTVKDSAHAAGTGIVDAAHDVKAGAVDSAHIIKHDVKNGVGDDDSD